MAYTPQKASELSLQLTPAYTPQKASTMDLEINVGIQTIEIFCAPIEIGFTVETADIKWAIGSPPPIEIGDIEYEPGILDIDVPLPPVQLEFGISMDTIGDITVHCAPIEIGMDIEPVLITRSVILTPIEMFIAPHVSSATGYFVDLAPIEIGMGIEKPRVDVHLSCLPVEMALAFNEIEVQRAVDLMPIEIGMEAVLVEEIKPFTTTYADSYFIFTLTGLENDLDDLEMKISSFQANRRSGNPSYLQVVVPYMKYAAEIAKRRDGTMKVDLAYKIRGQIVQRKTIVEALLKKTRTDEGPNSQSITLIGEKTMSFVPKDVSLGKFNYRSGYDGAMRYRFPRPNIHLNPGDTALMGDESMVVNAISYYYRASSTGVSSQMEIS